MDPAVNPGMDDNESQENRTGGGQERQIFCGISDEHLDPLDEKWKVKGEKQHTGI